MLIKYMSLTANAKRFCPFAPIIINEITPKSINGT